MNADRYDEFESDSYSVHFSSRGPRHRSLTAPDRARAKRRSFKKRPAPCPIRGMAHRRNKPICW